MRRRYLGASSSWAPDLLGLHRYRRGFHNLTGRDGPGAYTHPPTLTTLVDDLDCLEVWQPATTRLVMRVADIVARRGTFSARVAHSSHLFIPASFESLSCGLSYRRLHPRSLQYLHPRRA